jgi:hypothetical protein
LSSVFSSDMTLLDRVSSQFFMMSVKPCCSSFSWSFENNSFANPRLSTRLLLNFCCKDFYLSPKTSYSNSKVSKGFFFLFIFWFEFLSFECNPILSAFHELFFTLCLTMSCQKTPIKTKWKIIHGRQTK